MSEETPLWTPSADRIKNTVMARFMAFAADKVGRPFADYETLHTWSVRDRAAFWDAVWDFCGLRGEKGELVLDNPAAMPGATFFPEARLNFAENLLRRNDAGDAMIFRGEDKVERRLSWADLNALVSRLQQALLAAGVEPGDRVAAMLPNMPEAYAGMLAAASIGAIWSSCSPDFGERGVLDRFGQIEPKVFIACDAYWYNGKKIEVADKLKAVVEQLPSAETVLIVDYLGAAEEVASSLPRATDLAAALAPFEAKPVAFTRLPMTQPLYILFSSGTTGVPKCIVHSAGGTLLQHVKEHQLHCDIRPGDRVFYFTTCGWMMWNWLASALASEATLLLYDGSPFYPDGNVLFDFARDEKMTLFGTSAKFIDAVKKAGLRPRDTHELPALRVMTSTGSPLAPESFDFVYDAIKPDLHLASISGGTDIVACFVGGVPIKPVFKGEIQGPTLGMATDVWSEDGTPVKGEKGELVCTAPFPSMPIMFWNDPEGEKYHAAYFERFPGVWCHGDFAEWTSHGGMIIHGRSDATLNPGGVRIGTAEIYNVVEQIPEVVEALAIGQTWEDDVRVVLFVRLRDDMELTEELTKTIKTKIRQGASPRHVPAKVVAVEDIPRTKSGKITELAVRDVVHGREVKNKEALANPSALEFFAGLEELES
ncbi:acetoacetyl-CoA synthetase [Rhodobium orientis]|uniref:Acetoacetate--CoA ligase n=1 Tax=Rhodobium orientis TaxID=34017 RepID=A0A327JE25_9HYPH|nr:acetoacetate--CoA ligase [Rhodobium orientis]MBB4304970.1 acetoacetyl-CoA synthetase [Rhodobium orientis]MBK5948822.1 acetoacetate--CoA ligase [Rhodobium orientis]RAI23985.1 acetoacetate--CoA ligase [Rhodobium orientis]